MEGLLTCRLQDVLQPERVLNSEILSMVTGKPIGKFLCEQMEGSDEHLQRPCANSKEKTIFFHVGYFLCHCEKDSFSFSSAKFTEYRSVLLLSNNNTHLILPPSDSVSTFIAQVRVFWKK